MKAESPLKVSVKGRKQFINSGLIIQTKSLHKSNQVKGSDRLCKVVN